MFALSQVYMIIAIYGIIGGILFYALQKNRIQTSIVKQT
jgi:glucose uptake protein GlcU